MSLKDWKKNNIKNYIQYINIGDSWYNGKNISIIKNEKGFLITSNFVNFPAQVFDTKLEALKFAKQYMRTH